jgi:photosystem II Psb27 protein
LKEVRGVLELPKGDASADAKVKDLRTDINKWVAKYRREPKFSGKPSYG